ncbi:MAG: hypothetical protein AAFX39_09475 [Pseudomonadota bacterium]
MSDLAPEERLDTDTPVPEGRRPFFTWVILVWVLLGTLALIAGYATLFGLVPQVPEEDLAMLRSIGWPHWALAAVGAALNLTGAILLVRRKAIAAAVFTVALVLILLDTGYLYTTGQLETLFPHIGPLIVGIAVAAMIVGYAYNLKARRRIV